MKKLSLTVPVSIVETTLASLREAGERHSEGVVLWLGRRAPKDIITVEAYTPEQEAAYDFFRIPSRAMAVLLEHLGKTSTFIAAQVHSHPEQAFHSTADSTWAIVRHEGAISIVVPFFAQGTNPANFVGQIAAFRLSSKNVWKELTVRDRTKSIKLI